MRFKAIIYWSIAFLWSGFTSGQESYTSYFTGNTIDTISQPIGGICMMGGSVENDNAMRWFLERADGGDVLVLRASGSDGYWLHWAVENGKFEESVGTAANCLTVSTLENQQKLPIRFYPNPTSDTLFIESPVEMVSVQVHNLEGKPIFQSKLEKANQMVVPFHDFTSGIYTILVKTLEGEYTGKLIYKH